MQGNMISIFTRRCLSVAKHFNRPPLLEMVWPEKFLNCPPEISTAHPYSLRQFRPNDLENYKAIFKTTDMGIPPLDYWSNYILPNGFFVVENTKTNKLVAASFASHHPTKRHPSGGNLGWLAVDSDHRGKKLGTLVVSAVTSRLLYGGYERIYLETHDHRLSAIATYFKLGWVPLLYLPEMQFRWASICKQLNWPFTPLDWPTI